MADEYVLQSSSVPQDPVFDFQTRQHVWLPDSNNGNYPSGSIIFDGASLSNSGRWISMQNSYLTIPLVLQVSAPQGGLGAPGSAAARENAFAASLKNGYHQLISSMSVEITNNQVVNLTSFSNLDINYKLLSSMSREDELNFGPSIGFTKDSAESVQYFSQGSNTGLGECNNVINQSNFNPAAGWASYEASNKGRADRMLKCSSFDPTGAATVPAFTSATTCGTVAKNFVVASDTTINYYIVATLPLKILHDIFKKLPLTRGMYVRLILNTNTACSTSLTMTNAGGVATYTGFTSSSLNNMVPYMISPMDCTAAGAAVALVAGVSAGRVATVVTAGSGFSPPAAGTVQVSLGIAKSYNSTAAGAVAHPSMGQCRIYACMYEMTPMYEELYLKTNSVKDVYYNDILTFQILNVAAGAQINQLLSNGISRLRYLLMVPMIASASNGATQSLNTAWASGATNSLLGGCSPMASPFSSAPGTCGPQLHVGNFNVLISGVNIYQSNYLYKFEHWLQEVRGSNALNGGVPLSLSSGLLSQSDYENLYPYVYVDLSRRASQANDDISRSIQIVGTNLSNCPVDYYCVVGYERQIAISTGTGSLVI